MHLAWIPYDDEIKLTLNYLLFFFFVQRESRESPIKKRSTFKIFFKYFGFHFFNKSQFNALSVYYGRRIEKSKGAKTYPIAMKGKWYAGQWSELL